MKSSSMRSGQLPEKEFQALEEAVIALSKAYLADPIVRRVGRSNMLALAKRPSAYLTYCALVAALRRSPDALRTRSSVVVLVVPPHWQLELILNAADLCFGDPQNDSAKVVTLLHKVAAPGKTAHSLEIGDASRAHTLLVCIHAGVPLHRDLAVIAETTLQLDICAADHLQSLAKIMQCGSLLQSDIAYLRQLSDGAIDLLFRYGKPVTLAVERHREQYAQPTERPKRKVRTSVGYGEAGVWAQQLRDDLAMWRKGRLPWSEIDRGVLLFGPSGVGKTRFAEALAKECNTHFVPGSYATWQASGTLDAYLRAMYAAFAEAKANTPSILLIDELDSVGSRSRRDDRNGGYEQKVVSSLLEVLDGIHDRDGVIVIGTTNLPENIDSAILRSGRLEKHIHVGLPDADARTEILKVYFPSLSAHTGLREVAERLVGVSGADIERFSRNVRRIARHHRRQPLMDDLLSLAGTPSILSASDRYRVAVHECGHALLAHVMGAGRVKRVEIFDAGGELVSGVLTHGVAKIDQNSSLIDTQETLSAAICGWLGGLCAEDVVFGHRSSISGGHSQSDIARASELATRMIAELGLGHSLVYFPSKVPASDAGAVLRDPYVREKVESFLRDQYELAHSILSAQKPLLVAMAAALSEKRVLEEEELEQLFLLAAQNGAVIAP